MGAIESLDLSVLRAANALIGHSWSFDQLVLQLRASYLFKGMVVMAILWGLWFRAHRDEASRDNARSRLLATIFVACVAIVVGRGLALLLPFRPRPVHADQHGLNLAQGFDASVLDGWSSMPSDHAVLFFALAAGIFAVHRAWGMIALAHALLVVSLPRVLVGVHYPTDIAAGALIGLAIAGLLVRPVAALVRRWNLLSLERVRPALFYALMFAVTFQVASMFDSARSLLEDLAHMILA